jgi:hypothetical protein
MIILNPLLSFIIYFNFLKRITIYLFHYFTVIYNITSVPNLYVLFCHNVVPPSYNTPTTLNLLSQQASPIFSKPT